MTQEEKAKRYDEAIEKAKDFKNNPFAGYDGTDLISSLFPELAESEDERIRKAIIEIVKKDEERIGVNAHLKKIQWLEKQGEQKPVVPKFKVGDVIRNKWSNHTKKIVRIADDNSFYILDDGMPDDYISAPINNQENWVLVEQNPAWSEEDELHIREHERLVKRVWAIAEYENDKDTIHEMSNLSFFLKTLKPQPKQEWNEEDSPYYDDICEILINLLHSETANINKNAVQKDLDWLKSLRPQNTWKPSDEQMNALDSTLQYSQVSHNSFEYLNSLYNDLKKLRKE